MDVAQVSCHIHHRPQDLQVVGVSRCIQGIPTTTPTVKANLQTIAHAFLAKRQGQKHLPSPKMLRASQVVESIAKVTVPR